MPFVWHTGCTLQLENPGDYCPAAVPTSFPGLRARRVWDINKTPTRRKSIYKIYKSRLEPTYHRLVASNREKLGFVTLRSPYVLVCRRQDRQRHQTVLLGNRMKNANKKTCPTSKKSNTTSRTNSTDQCEGRQCMKQNTSYSKRRQSISSTRFTFKAGHVKKMNHIIRRKILTSRLLNISTKRHQCAMQAVCIRIYLRFQNPARLMSCAANSCPQK